MTLESFLGPNLITKVLFYSAVVFFIGDFLATLFTIIYQNFWYKHVMRSRYDQSYNPSCTIVVPCKGIPKDFGKNLEGFLELEYENYDVIYVVESEKDSAVPTIKSIVDKNPRARLVVAGLTKSCCQKNYNMLEALKLAGNPDLYVFADSDIRPKPYWLKELILPLSNPKVTITTGFRWLYPTKGTVGELLHSAVNILMYIMFTVACFSGGVGLWGGSMAMRKRDFDALGVAKKWSTTVVDDMSLSQIIMKTRKKAVLVSTCITHTDDLIDSVKKTVIWSERQIAYLKAYQKAIWFFMALPLVIFALTLIFLLPYALIASLITHKSFFAFGGGAGLIYYFGEFVTVLLYPFIGPMPSFLKFFVLHPFLRLAHIFSYLLTYRSNTMLWAGIKYTLTFSGDVSKIERPETNV